MSQSTIPTREEALAQNPGMSRDRLDRIDRLNEIRDRLEKLGLIPSQQKSEQPLHSHSHDRQPECMFRLHHLQD